MFAETNVISFLITLIAYTVSGKETLVRPPLHLHCGNRVLTVGKSVLYVSYKKRDPPASYSEDPGSNLGPRPDTPTEDFRSFPQSLQGDAGIVY
jgi:hypothetical protein